VAVAPSTQAAAYVEISQILKAVEVFFLRGIEFERLSADEDKEDRIFFKNSILVSNLKNKILPVRVGKRQQHLSISCINVLFPFQEIGYRLPRL
jgi:hypothetical protein